MKSKCILCKREEEIAWHDWERSVGSIDLCLHCLKWAMPYEVKNRKTCLKCNEFFSPKFSGQKLCIGCWRKEKYGKTT